MNRVTEEFAMPLADADDLPEIGLISDLMTLIKARLSLLVIITTFVGFCMASEARLDWLLLFNAIFGTTLAAAAAAVLNQWTESHVDRLMERTKSRPLPAGRMSPASALVFGMVLTFVGVGWLWMTANGLSALLAASTVFIYLFLYTPLKRRTAFCTIVGAVSGAIPPVIGWTAAQGSHPTLGLGAWVLFGILFTWQMPHFLAIAWMYRDEYAQAGFIMLKRDDVSGAITALTSLAFSLALGAICIVPFGAGTHGRVYLIGAILFNAIFIFFAVRFLLERNRVSARRLFFTSIFYLPLILGLMVFTKS
ncbi:MAG: Protoheme farnesyltransferase [Chthoniobacteraceae bacterium]|nr:Protoheme farnesyltransferase [Chthoniobacteraceae bacterium]